MWRHSVHLEISGKQKKPATDLACFTTSAECSFFLRGDYPVHYLYCYHCRSLEHVWLEIISLKSSQNRAREVVERLASHWQNPLGGMTSQKGGPAAEYCAKWQQRRRILGFCEDEFHKENLLHFRGWKFGEELNLVRDFYLCWPKIHFCEWPFPLSLILDVNHITKWQWQIWVPDYLDVSRMEQLNVVIAEVTYLFQWLSMADTNNCNTKLFTGCVESGLRGHV